MSSPAPIATEVGGEAASMVTRRAAGGNRGAARAGSVASPTPP
jgi:hypothetical protein